MVFHGTSLPWQSEKRWLVQQPQLWLPEDTILDARSLQSEKCMLFARLQPIPFLTWQEKAETPASWSKQDTSSCFLQKLVEKRKILNKINVIKYNLPVCNWWRWAITSSMRIRKVWSQAVYLHSLSAMAECLPALEGAWPNLYVQFSFLTGTTEKLAN